MGEITGLVAPPGGASQGVSMGGTISSLTKLQQLLRNRAVGYPTVLSTPAVVTPSLANAQPTTTNPVKIIPPVYRPAVMTAAPAASATSATLSSSFTGVTGTYPCWFGQNGPNIASSTVTALVLGATTQVTLTAVTNFAIGQTVFFGGLGGCVQINGLAGLVSNIVSNTLTVAINSTGFTAWSSGGSVTADPFGLAENRNVLLTNGSTAISWAADSRGGLQYAAGGAFVYVGGAHIFNSPYLNVFSSANIQPGGAWAYQVPGSINSGENFLFAGVQQPSSYFSNAVQQSINNAHFLFDGRFLEILANVGTTVQMLVNGQYATSALTQWTVAGNSWNQFDFGASSLGVMKRIDLYWQGGIGCICTGPTDTIMPWNRNADVAMVAHGDSYMQQPSAQFSSGIAGEICMALGAAHILNGGCGGSGYLQSVNAGNSLAGFNDLSIASSCDLWLSTFGHNDANAGWTQNQLTSQCQTYFNLVRAKYPTAVIAATGPLTQSEVNATTSSWQNTRTWIKNALQTITAPWVFIDNLTGNWYNSSGATGTIYASSGYAGTNQGGNGVSVNYLGWPFAETPQPVGTFITGTGFTGTLTTYGNANVYVQADDVHPTPAGCLYWGRILAEAIREAVLAL